MSIWKRICYFKCPVTLSFVYLEVDEDIGLRQCRHLLLSGLGILEFVSHSSFSSPPALLLTCIGKGINDQAYNTY